MLKRIYLFAFIFMTQVFSLTAEEGEVMSGRDQGMWHTLILIGIFAVFFYLIMWRPEQKRRKALEEQRAALKKGDKVTAMGILGTVSSIKDHTVVLKMVDGAKIEFLKAAISEVMSESEAQDSEA